MNVGAVPVSPIPGTTEKFRFLVLSAVTFFQVQCDLDVTIVSILA